jgi:hypothetical protein
LRIASVATLVIAAALVVAGRPASAAVPIGFGKSLLKLQTSNLPTTLQFGPDGRLYVGQFDGTITAYGIARHGPNDYRVSDAEAITAIQSIPNHDDDGALDPDLTTRLVTGLLVVGTAAHPVIYVSSSDPRYGTVRGPDLGTDTNSGVISRLTWDGSAWAREDLVRGLPRSRNVHASNGLALDPSTDTLYVAQGGNTNMGAPSIGFQNLPEYALSASILSIDLDGLGTLPYDLPTLNDPARAGDPDAHDPFGGAGGNNQAMMVPGGPVQVYSPGYRNPYDVIIASNGSMYATDNGNNAGEGGMPVGEGPGGTCTNDISEPGAFGYDNLARVTPGYYGGHPDPTRGNFSNTFAGQHPVPVGMIQARQCDFRTAGDDRRSIAVFPSSTDGLTEYTASDFGGAMQGNLLTTEWDNWVSRVVLSADGTSVVSNSKLFANAGSNPLDITAQDDAGSFPGTIWMADQAASTITVFEPNDYGGATPTCTGADSSADEDGDGFTNHDEILNSTDPCSAGDVPADADGDGTSNLLDPDDDNDQKPDTTDPFALDRKNGNQTTIPVRYTWDPGSPTVGGILGSGFTGLMTNRSSDYGSLYDPSQLAVGGAPGEFAIEQVPDNTADLKRNDQRFGFQFGVNARPQFFTGTFVVHTSLVTPFAGFTPMGAQQFGVYVGSGDQDNFVKLVVTANGGKGGVLFGRELKGVASAQRVKKVTLPGPDRVDLYLLVDPVKHTIQGSYTTTKGAVTSAKFTMGTPVSVPLGWFTGGPTRTAVGLSSTSKGPAPPFPALWDLIEVTKA